MLLLRQQRKIAHLKSLQLIMMLTCLLIWISWKKNNTDVTIQAHKHAWYVKIVVLT